jgi:hypothetical protein
MSALAHGYTTGAVETVYTLAHERPDETAVVFDFLVGRDAVGWWRHDFDGRGIYDGVGECDLDEIRDELAESAPAAYVIELRSAAAALEAAVSGLLEVAESAAHSGDIDAADQLAARAGEIERERLRALDEVVRTCDAAWDEAIERVEHARGEDPDSLPGALRTVELLWTARQAVRRMLRTQRRSV